MDHMEKLLEQAANIEAKLSELSSTRAKDAQQAADMAEQIKALSEEQAKLGKKMLDLQQKAQTVSVGGEKNRLSWCPVHRKPALCRLDGRQDHEGDACCRFSSCDSGRIRSC